MILQIRASAGSGKTYTLTRRFLDLLHKAQPGSPSGGCSLHGRLDGYDMAEILAATFTNKAAAEMKSRVLGGLKQQALEARAAGAQGSESERWVERVLRHYGRLNIRTIDSLLASLARLSALELGLPPDFQPSFDAAEYFTPLYDALMEDLAADRPDFSDFQLAPVAERPEFLTSDGAALRHGLEASCAALLRLGDFSGFTTRGRLHNLVLALTDRMLRGLPTPLMDADAIHARINALHAAVTDAGKTMLLRIDEEKLKAAAHFLTYVRKCRDSQAYRPLPESVYRHKGELDECLNKASKGTASNAADKAFADFMQTVASYEHSLPIYRHALQLAPLVLLAHEMSARVEAKQQESGLVPAIRLPGLAASLLNGDSGVSDALCRFGTRLSRMLLDEFQDTSREQWEALRPLALECLSTGGSLIYVGDVKQAIYGWRGGDAHLFDEASREPELTAVAPHAQALVLGDNWRSHPAVVAHNNAFFSLLAEPATARAVMEGMLPQGTPDPYVTDACEEVSRIFAETAQNIPAAKDWTADPNHSLAAVRLYLAEGDTTAEVSALVRERLHRLLFEELLPHWHCRDIAVLVRSGDEATLIAEWLGIWGLPVVTENSFRLDANAVVSRLVSFLAFLDYPPDDMAFLECLSGPECLGELEEISRSALTDWLARRLSVKAESRPPLYRLFQRDFPAIWDRVFAPFHAESGLMSAYDTLAEAARRFKLYRRYPEHMAFLRRLLEMAHLAEMQGHTSLAAFLAFWRQSGQEEKLPLPENMDAVRIMTIHKAKGLEFPVVILPFQHRGKRRDPELTAVNHQGMQLLTRAGKELDNLYYPACVTDELERLNLLYVAWTRPVYALHTFITRPKRAATPLARALETLLGVYKDRQGDTLCTWETLAQPADGLLDEDGPNSPDGNEQPEATFALPVTPPSAPIPEAPAASPDADDHEHTHTPLTLDLPWRPMRWLPRLKIYRSPLGKETEEGFSPRQRGILAHLCLEHLFLPCHDEGKKCPADAEVARAVRQGLRLYPLPLPDPEAVAIQMQQTLTWFASLTDAPFWLRYGQREQGVMDADAKLYRVDLLVDEAQYPHHTQTAAPQGLLAIDYKTGRAGPDDTALPEHLEQVSRYMELLTEAAGRPVRGLLVYLDERLLVPVASGAEHSGGAA